MAKVNNMTASMPSDMYWFQQVDSLETELLADVKQEVPKHLEEGEVVDGVYTLFAVAVHTIMSEVMLSALPTTEGLYDPIVNWVDAGLSIVQGGRQLFDDETHRPLVTKVKGLSNIASGVGLTVITAIASTLGAAAAATLSAQGLAAAFAVAFLISCDEVVRSARKMTDSEYWVVDNIKEWDRLNTKTIPKLKAQIVRLDHPGFLSRKNEALQWAIGRKKERLIYLEKLEQELGQDIKDRVTTHEKCWDSYQTHFMNKDPISSHAQTLIGDQTDFYSSKREEIENKVTKKCKKELNESLVHAAMTGLAFTGMLLLCIPGAQPAGAILIGVTVALFAIKYADLIAKNAPQVGDYLKNKVVSNQDVKSDVELTVFKR